MLSKNKIKYIQSLRDKKNRRTEKCFLIEGEKMLQEVLDSETQIKEIYCTEDFFEKNRPLFSKKNLSPLWATPQDLGISGNLETNNAGIAVLPFLAENHFSFELFFQKNDTLALILDNIQDPGNMGTILRIADWFGISEVICSEDSVERYNPKVLGATMGAFLRLNIYYVDLVDFFERLKTFQQENNANSNNNPNSNNNANNNNNPNNNNKTADNSTNIQVIGAILDGGHSLYDTQFSKKSFLVMGNESKGISQKLYPYITQKVFIPKFGGAESLNVGVATAIFCNHWRQNL